MKQSRIMSLVEAATNVVVGYGLAIATQIVVFPWFGLQADLPGASDHRASIPDRLAAAELPAAAAVRAAPRPAVRGLFRAALDQQIRHHDLPGFGDQRSVCGVAGIGGTAREGRECRCHDRVGVMEIVAGATSWAHGCAVAPAYFGQLRDAGDTAQIVDIAIRKPVWCDG
jgi:hypothetical protein